MTSNIVLSERLIRKAWFLILRHFKENPSYFRDTCKDMGISRSEKKLSEGIEILETSKFELDFNDEVEGIWHKNNDIKISFVTKILHGYEADICAVINNQILDGRVRTNKKILKGGIAQTIFNISATNWQKKTNSNQIVFNKNLGKEVNPKKILSLYEYVKKIIVNYPREYNYLIDEISFLQLELEKELLSKNKWGEFKNGSAGTQNHYKVWSKTNNFPKQLLNTKWLRYERRDSVSIDPNSIMSSRGFSVGCIELIGGSKKFSVRETIVSLDTNNIETTNILDGVCRFESNTNYLFIEMNRIDQEEANKLGVTSIYILNIHRMDIQNQEVIVGYHIFYSLIKHKYLVKTTLLIKFKDELDLLFIPKIINKTDSEYKKIPILIRRFFAERSMNRLTIPSTAISHLEKISDNSGTLQDFLARQGKIYDDIILSGFTGNFNLFYYFKKNHPINDDKKYLSGIRQDRVIIEYDDELCELRGEFLHKEKEVYRGKGFRKNRTIQFLLEQKKSTNPLGEKFFHTSDNNRKSVFFSFPVPHYDDYFFKDEIENNLSFEGVLSGIEDESGLPLSFSALLVRECVEIDLSNPNNLMTAKLLTHFKKLSATYLATDSFFNHFSS
ncbi:hypothetical protein [Runella limosa]|uniref:hypothetical protein n=1 Tax=Runella limosa TaxID=370978 RepID=UPI0004202D50|nr:hypothetical protein [Runella limosa]